MGPVNFSMWQCEVLDILCLQELDIALEEKPKEMNDIDLAIRSIAKLVVLFAPVSLRI